MGSVVSWQLKWNLLLLFLLLALSNVLPQTEQMTLAAMQYLLPLYLLKHHLCFIGTIILSEHICCYLSYTSTQSQHFGGEERR